MSSINRWEAVQAYGFRPFFVMLPAYIAVSILLWGLVLSGWLPLFFTEQVVVWHIYEMLYGIASAAIAGFILTAAPEFFDNTKPFTGKPLLALAALWLLGRLTFWSIDVLGVGIVALTNLPFLLWVIVLIARPVFSDRSRKHLGFALIFIALWLTQIWFFAARAGFVAANDLQVLKFSVGLFIILILVALRRISVGVTNTWLQRREIDEVFLARPPAYNIAILCIALFTVVEFINPFNPVLGWLGLAAAASLLNLLNDFFLDEARPLREPYLAAVAAIPVLMATGYGLMGIDYLHDGFYGLNHFRHFLTTGAFGLAVFMVMSIVGTVHTGRTLKTSPWMLTCIVLIVVATLARGLIPFFPQMSQTLYMASALLWALPFVIYLVRFFPFLTSPRADGLPG